MDEQERLRRLRDRRATLTGSTDPADEFERARLDQEIAEAEQRSLVGSGAPRTDTRLEGASAGCYVAALMRLGPHGVHARRLRADARAGTARALNRLRLAVRGVRAAFAHARVSGEPRRPGRASRPRRGPARAAPARPRLDLRGIRGVGVACDFEPDPACVPDPGGLPAAG